MANDLVKTAVNDDPFKMGMYAVVKGKNDSVTLLDEYKKAGYTAIIDYWDKNTLSEKPLILFDAASDVVKRGESFVSVDMRKQMIKDLANSTEFIKHPARLDAETLAKYYEATGQ